MLRNSFRKIHKWIFIFVGLFMLLWVLTGVIISLPVGMDWKRPDRNYTALFDTQYAGKLTVSPGQAMASLQKEHSKTLVIRSVHFEKINDRIFYVIQDSDHLHHLVDSMTGGVYRMSLQEARDIVRKMYGKQGMALEETMINQHSLSYPYGELPVYRFRFQSDSSVQYYVSPVSARVMKSNRMTRVRSIAGMFHDFGPISYITGRDAVRWTLMVFIGLLALVGTVTGLYLTLPVRRRR